MNDIEQNWADVKRDKSARDKLKSNFGHRSLHKEMVEERKEGVREPDAPVVHPHELEQQMM